MEDILYHIFFVVFSDDSLIKCTSGYITVLDGNQVIILKHSSQRGE